MPTIAELTSTFPRPGRVEWIGIRPARRQPMVVLDAVAIGHGGLEGDRRNKEGIRAVTLIQQEHLPVIAALAGLGEIDPAALRRNIVVSGVSLIALKERRFRIGSVLLEGTGICAPCSRMEEVLGPGGYNAMRGHGGITARVAGAGTVRVADAVVAFDPSPVLNAP